MILQALSWFSIGRQVGSRAISFSTVPPQLCHRPTLTTSMGGLSFIIPRQDNRTRPPRARTDYPSDFWGEKLQTHPLSYISQRVKRPQDVWPLESSLPPDRAASGAPVLRARRPRRSDQENEPFLELEHYLD